MKHRRPMMLLLLAFAVVTSPSFAESGLTKDPLVPRVPATEAEYRAQPAQTVLSHAVVKFHEGTHVRLRDQVLIALDRDAAERGRLAALGLEATQVDRDVAEVGRILALEPRVQGVKRLFTADEETLARWKETGEAQTGRQLADLDLYYELVLPARTTAGEVAGLLAELNAVPSVEVAYAAPQPEPAALPGMGQVTAAVTGNFQGSQGYLNAAPQGVDALFAWTVAGGKGQGVRIVDIEGAWRTTHEDMPAFFHTGGTQFTDLSWRNHGTAVLGVMVGRDNGLGVTGIANQAQAGYESIRTQTTASAIANAALAVGSGGIVLIELHSRGPANSSPCTCNTSQCDYIAMEYWQDNYDAIALATANGVLVVEAAGNGSSNLNDAAYGNRFNRTTRDSGAILVAASLSSGRTPTCWTNWGTRIDLHGWGENVVSMGYGNLFNGGGENFWYTNTFSGTSSASPIVTASAAVVQGVARAGTQGTQSPAAIRQLLVNTGTPQVAGPKNIGRLPNLRAAITQLQASDVQVLSPVPAGPDGAVNEQ